MQAASHLQFSVITQIKAISGTAARERLHQIGKNAGDHLGDNPLCSSQMNRPTAALPCIDSTTIRLPVLFELIALPSLHRRSSSVKEINAPKKNRFERSHTFNSCHFNFIICDLNFT